MRKILYTAACLTLSLVLYTSCTKDIEGRTDNTPALNPSSQDIDAGQWKLILLPKPDTFAVAAPALPGTPGYAADINEIKAYQQNLTQEQKDNIKYWAAGGVLRWNEITRELVSRYNLPPYQNEDGTYPAPNQQNPFAYPQFPFANPPFAARAYAYISAAQYDALVACWHYKKLYNQKRPYDADSSVKALAGKTDLPSYPSEAAVLAGATAEIMKLMFPTEIANIQQKLEEQELAAIMSGLATRADVAAGEALGRQIASAFAARARADKAGVAGGNPDYWNSLITKTQAKGETPWYSLETPKRPPMLPLFGEVRTFLFDSATRVSVRAGSPFSTNSNEFAKENEAAYLQIKTPTREQIRIVQFWADGVGTYTPPGHWNAIAAEDFIKQNYSEVRWARNMALLNMAEMDAAIVCWDSKYYYFNPRPSQMMTDIKTLTGVPNFPSYISGHSTFSEAAATILGHIIPANATAYHEMSKEAAMSRFISGIHTMMDCDSGLAAGNRVGQYAVLRAQSDGAE